MPINLYPDRRSIRLPGFDYSLPGSYFITICAYKKQPFFGEIIQDQMILNDWGKIVEEEWQKTSTLRSYLGLGAYVVMPNHFHAILHILENINDDPIPGGISTDSLASGSSNDLRCTGRARSARTQDEISRQEFGNLVPGSIPIVLRSFKSAVTNRINKMRNDPGSPVWHRNYYEHIIRTEKAYSQIEAYILNNPSAWLKDSYFISKDR